jgi:hypothetical protein
MIRLLRMYFPRNWEFGSALSKLRNLGGGGCNLSIPPPRYATVLHTSRFSACRQVPIIASQSSETQEDIGVFTQPGRLAGRKNTEVCERVYKQHVSISNTCTTLTDSIPLFCNYLCICIYPSNTIYM